MSNIPVKILGTGAHLPQKLVTTSALEKKLGYLPGQLKQASDVDSRYFVDNETSSEMGFKAVEEALENARLKKSDIDVIVSVSGVPQQAIPTNAALIHEKLQLNDTTFAFDINATCLSFLTGFFTLAQLIKSGVYRRAILVSSDIGSKGLNPKDPKTASLFGDGAAAVILGPSSGLGILSSYFKIKSAYANDCVCKAGGTLVGVKNDIAHEELYFQMNGPKLLKATSLSIVEMIQIFIRKAEENINLFIPHQASPLALDLFQKKLNIPDEKFIHIVRNYGNMIATSLPFALHKAIEERRLKRGDKAVLFGTGAGITIGGVLFEY